MEWKKTNISSSELEKQQEAYIKEALEMAKRSVVGELDKTAAAKAEAEKLAEEKAAAAKAEAEKLAEEKAAAAKAEAEKLAAEKAAAAKAEAERLAAEKAEAAKSEAERLAAEKAEADREETERLAAAAKAESERLAAEKEAEELTKFSDQEKQEPDKSNCEKKDTCCEQADSDIIDIGELKKKREEQSGQKGSGNAPQNNTSGPTNLNGYINEHNNKAQCNCPNCQRKRAQQ